MERTMTEHTSGKRPHRTWTEAEIEAIAAADTEFPPITEEDLARAVAVPARRRARIPGPVRIDPTAADTGKPEQP
jgi:hypothetical protein